MNNEVVSEAESVPDQVGDVLRAKHAGSPRGSADRAQQRSVICRAGSRVLALKGFGAVGGLGEAETLHDVR